MTKTITQTLKIKDFPFVINDKNGKVIYYEDHTGYWHKREYDSNGEEIYFENSDGYWDKYEYDSNGNQIYYENSKGYWYKCKYDSNGKEIYCEDSTGYKREYDSNGNEIYYETSDGYIKDNRPKKIIELTIEDIAKLKGVDASLIRIKE